MVTYKMQTTQVLQGSFIHNENSMNARERGDIRWKS